MLYPLSYKRWVSLGDAQNNLSSLPETFAKANPLLIPQDDRCR